MKIGIVNCQWVDNHGAVWVGYSLQEAVKQISQCDSVEIIDCATGNSGLWPRIKGKARKVFDRGTKDEEMIKQLQEKHNRFEQFRKQYLNRTERFKSIDSELLKRPYTHCITGSDVVWNPDITADKISYVYYLKFVPDTAKRIAYAASIGTDDVKTLGKMRNRYKALIADFNAVSVREESAKAFLQQLLSQQIALVADPVFLLDRSDYFNLSDFSARVCAEKYLYVYLFSFNQEAVEAAVRLAEKENLTIVYHLDSAGLTALRQWFPARRSIEMATTGPIDFLNHIRHAEYVITNSFHATAFSLIFHKEVFTFSRMKAGVDISARMRDLLNTLGIRDRFIDHGKKGIIDQPIDFQEVDQRIDLMRRESLTFLSEALLENERG